MLGGARIFHKHANIILTLGDATARDVMGLMELAQETVERELGTGSSPRSASSASSEPRPLSPLRRRGIQDEIGRGPRRRWPFGVLLPGSRSLGIRVLRLRRVFWLGP